MAGYRKKDFHALLVEIEIAVPFIKQSGNIYPIFKIPSLIKPCHAHMSTGMDVPTALFVVQSFNKSCYSQLSNSMQNSMKKKELRNVNNELLLREKNARCGL